RAGVLYVVLANGGYRVMDELAAEQGVAGPWPGVEVEIAALARALGCRAGRARTRPGRRRARARRPGRAVPARGGGGAGLRPRALRPGEQAGPERAEEERRARAPDSPAAKTRLGTSPAPGPRAPARAA